MTDTLLVEVRTEELPPQAVSVLAHRFPLALLKLLAGQGFVDNNAPCSEHLATPRRFAALINNVRGQTESQNVKRRGPQLKDCYDGNKPTKALQGFMRAVGENDATKLGRESEGGRDYIVWQGTKPGIALGEVLARMVADATTGIGELPTMKWDDNDYAFVRPVRGLIMMHGKSVIKGEVMGVQSGNKTRGHPALADRDIKIASAEEYEETLRQAKVIAAYNEREGEIYRQAHRQAEVLDIASFFFGGKPRIGENEQSRKVYADNAAICEYPSVYRGAIDKEFRRLPEECVRSCLITHHKCLPFLAHEWDGADKKAHALIGFFFVADNAPENEQNIMNGVNAVVRARLRDIAFYQQTDEKMTEQDAREKLGGIVYHQKLGSQKERAERIIKLAAAIGKVMNLDNDDSAKLRRAAEVCKLDLPTMMIGEYPELAGKMAAIYAWKKWQIGQIAAIVERHGNDDFNFYLGEGSAALPSVALFLADKLEKVVGMFVIGEKPAGRKDPHGLRRAAGQIAGMLAPRHTDMAGEMPGEVAERMGDISITKLIKVARDVFGDFDKQKADIGEMREFIVRRIALPGINAEVQNAVYALRPDYLAEIPRRCKALQNFLLNPQAQVLITANKRINNILRKSSASADDGGVSFLPDPDPALFREDAERQLHACITLLARETAQRIKSGDYEGALNSLAEQAAAPIAAFFDNCMVNDKDAAIRANRLALLARLRAQLNSIADLAQL